MKTMKLLYFNYNSCSAWCISHASKAFRERHPHKIIAASLQTGLVYEVDSLSDIDIDPTCLSYIFVFDEPVYKARLKMLYRAESERQALERKYIRVFHTNLRQYIDDQHDVILSIGPHIMSDVRLLKTTVIKCNHEELLKADLKATLRNVIRDQYRSYPKNCEQWLEAFLGDLPRTTQGYPVKLPKMIDERMFDKPLTATLNDFIVGYMTTIIDPQLEMEVTKALESQLSNFNRSIVVYNSFDDLQGRIIEELKKKHLSYRDVGCGIEVNMKTLIKLNISYTMLDFMM